MKKQLTKEQKDLCKAQYFKDGQLTNSSVEINNLRNSIWNSMPEIEKNKIYKQYSYKF